MLYLFRVIITINIVSATRSISMVNIAIMIVIASVDKIVMVGSMALVLSRLSSVSLL